MFTQIVNPAQCFTAFGKNLNFQYFVALRAVRVRCVLIFRNTSHVDQCSLRQNLYSLGRCALRLKSCGIRHLLPWFESLFAKNIYIYIYIYLVL